MLKVFVLFALCPLVLAENFITIHRQTFRHFFWREQATSCSTTCGLGVMGVSYRCYSRNTAKFVPDSKCDPRKKPITIRRSCKLSECQPRWEVGLWENCSAHCGLGVIERRVICVQYGVALRRGESPAFEEVPDLHCLRSGQIKPPGEKICPRQKCSHWRVGRWSPCSAVCGGAGVQKRRVRCWRKLPDRKPCDPLIRPASERPCNNDNAISDQCLQSKKISMEARYAQKRPELVVKLEDHKVRPRYFTGKWSKCSKTCGTEPGHRFRIVQCRRYFPQLRLFADVKEEECQTLPKPPRSKMCNSKRKPCTNFGNEISVNHWKFKSFDWIETGFSTCSVTCGGGYRKNVILCVGNIDGNRQVPVEDYNCVNQTRPVERFEICSSNPCQPEWKVTNTSKCSVTCGRGVKIRFSVCTRRQPELDLAEELPEFMCPLYTKPPQVIPCNSDPCQPIWKMETWSPCSVSCGVGHQSRRVVCILPIRPGYYETTEEEDCEKLLNERPPTTQKCVKLGKCLNETLIDTSVHVHNNENSDITHFLGGSIYAVSSPRSSLTLICPQRSKRSTGVKWQKDGHLIEEVDTVKSADDGASLLSVAPVTPKVSGNYSCSSPDKEDGFVYSSKVVVGNDPEDVERHFFGSKPMSSIKFNWKQIDEYFIENRTDIDFKSDSDKLEASIYVADKCFGRSNQSCISLNDNCLFGCALRIGHSINSKANSLLSQPVSFVDIATCFDFEELYSERLDQLSSTKEPALLPVPFNSQCAPKFDPTWKIRKTGSCDVGRCLSSFDIAIADLSVRCQPLKAEPRLTEKTFYLDESYCPSSARPLDYTYCFAPECSKRRRKR